MSKTDPVPTTARLAWVPRSGIVHIVDNPKEPILHTRCGRNLKNAWIEKDSALAHKEGGLQLCPNCGNDAEFDIVNRQAAAVGNRKRMDHFLEMEAGKENHQRRVEASAYIVKALGKALKDIPGFEIGKSTIYPGSVVFEAIIASQPDQDGTIHKFVVTANLRLDSAKEAEEQIKKHDDNFWRDL